MATSAAAPAAAAAPLPASFDACVQRVRDAPASAKLTDAQRLQLYGLYKQATEGDNASKAPGLLDFVGRSKWCVSWQLYACPLIDQPQFNRYKPSDRTQQERVEGAGGGGGRRSHAAVHSMRGLVVSVRVRRWIVIGCRCRCRCCGFQWSRWWGAELWRGGRQHHGRHRAGRAVRACELGCARVDECLDEYEHARLMVNQEYRD